RQRLAVGLDEDARRLRAGKAAAVRGPRADAERLRAEEAVGGGGEDLYEPLLVAERHRSQTTPCVTVPPLRPADGALGALLVVSCGSRTQRNHRDQREPGFAHVGVSSVE